MEQVAANSKHHQASVPVQADPSGCTDPSSAISAYLPRSHKPLAPSSGISHMVNSRLSFELDHQLEQLALPSATALLRAWPVVLTH